MTRTRRPRHARTSVLAPTRTLVGGGALAAVVAVALVTAAALSDGPAVAEARAATHPSAPRVAPPMAAPAPAATPTLDDGPPLSAADLAALGKHDGAKSRVLPAVHDSAPASALAASGIPVTALLAYQQAARREAQLDPACGLSWPLLAGIGRVESDHGRFAGATLHSDGLSTPPVIGIPLNGHGTALIRDTDHGRLDGDTVYDHAVGPMQFIPSTWASWGVDANHDGVKDPFNIFDAAAAAADYLCAAGRNLTTTHGQVQAILSYNYSYDYVSLVMGVERIYAKDVGISVPVLPTTADTGRPTQPPALPPVDPGPPRGASGSTPTPKPKPSPSPSSTAPSGPSSSSSSSDPGTPTAPSSDPASSSSPPPSSSSAAPDPAPASPSSDASSPSDAPTSPSGS